MQIRRHLTLLATILALAAAVSSGGGVARFVHVMLAHGGTACAAGGADGSTDCHAAHMHADAPGSTPGAPHVPGTPHDPNAPSDDCAVCAELAVNLLAPTLLGFFSTSVEVLAIVHTREAAQLPAPRAPGVVAARPPPVLA